MISRRTVLKSVATYSSGLMLAHSLGCGGSSGDGSRDKPLITDRSMPERYELAYSFAGDGLLQSAALIGIALSSVNDVYITRLSDPALTNQTNEPRVFRFTAGGEPGRTTQSLFLESSQRMTEGIKALCIAPDDTIYASFYVDPGNITTPNQKNIVVYGSDGTILRQFNLDRESHNRQMLIGLSGAIYRYGTISNNFAPIVYEFSNSGQFVRNFSPTPVGVIASAPSNTSLVEDVSGNLLVFGDRGSRPSVAGDIEPTEGILETFNASSQTIQRVKATPPVFDIGNRVSSGLGNSIAYNVSNVLGRDSGSNFYVNSIESTGTTSYGVFIRKFSPDGKERAAIRLDSATPESPERETLHDFAVSGDGTVFAVVRSKDNASVAVRVYRRVA